MWDSDSSGLNYTHWQKYQPSDLYDCVLANGYISPRDESVDMTWAVAPCDCDENIEKDVCALCQQSP